MATTRLNTVYFTIFVPEKREPEEGAPLFFVPISAGFPSPAEDYVQEQLDLHKLLVRNQAATFFLKVKGDSMSGAGIRDGDLLVVDRSVAPVSGKIVIAAWEGDLVVKRLKIKDKRVWLVPHVFSLPPEGRPGVLVYSCLTY